MKKNIIIILSVFLLIALTMVLTTGLARKDGFCPPLTTDPVTVHLDTPHPDSYFQAMISGDAMPSINGAYQSWCIDTSALHLETDYSALAYCSYNTLPFILPPSFIAGNLDLMNWVLNQDYIGSTSPSGGVYDVLDVQCAIWQLIGQSYNHDDLVKVNEIVTAANEHDGFTPGYNDMYAVILVPVDEAGSQITTAQITIITLTVPRLEN